MTYLQFKEICSGYLKNWALYSPECVELLAMLCAHESLGGKFRRQIGGGPARGLFGMEAETHNSIWDNSDKIKPNAIKFGIKREESKVENNDEYAIFVARHYLMMDTKPLPKTPNEMAKYAKSYWNRTGDATPEKYLNDYNSWIAGKI